MTFGEAEKKQNVLKWQWNLGSMHERLSHSRRGSIPIFVSGIGQVIQREFRGSAKFGDMGYLSRDGGMTDLLRRWKISQQSEDLQAKIGNKGWGKRKERGRGGEGKAESLLFLP